MKLFRDKRKFEDSWRFEGDTDPQSSARKFSTDDWEMLTSVGGYQKEWLKVVEDNLEVGFLPRMNIVREKIASGDFQPDDPEVRVASLPDSQLRRLKQALEKNIEVTEAQPPKKGPLSFLRK